jgi:predicted transcriptional regulator
MPVVEAEEARTLVELAVRVVAEAVQKAVHTSGRLAQIHSKHNQALQTLAEVAEVRHTVVLVAPEQAEAELSLLPTRLSQLSLHSHFHRG